jgi:hypothetical protein
LLGIRCCSGRLFNFKNTSGKTNSALLFKHGQSVIMRTGGPRRCIAVSLSLYIPPLDSTNSWELTAGKLVLRRAWLCCAVRRGSSLLELSAEGNV